MTVLFFSLWKSPTAHFPICSQPVPKEWYHDQSSTALRPEVAAMK